jgi:hypothetical protein
VRPARRESGFDPQPGHAGKLGWDFFRKIGIVFGDHATKAIDDAFDAACTALHDSGQPQIVYEVIAKRIMAARTPAAMPMPMPMPSIRQKIQKAGGVSASTVIGAVRSTSRTSR